MEDDKQKFSELAKEKVARVKQHLVDHKTPYIIGTVGVGCFVAGYFLRSAGCPDIVQTIDGKGNVVAAINKSKNVDVVIEYVKARNYVANPVRCLDTLEEWASQIEAAAAKGIDPAILSKHLNDKLPNANGLHFKRI